MLQVRNEILTASVHDVHKTHFSLKIWSTGGLMEVPQMIALHVAVTTDREWGGISQAAN